MRKTFKRTLSLLLALLLACSGSAAAFAMPKSETRQDTAVYCGSQNALGQIVQNLTDSDGGENGYSISYLHVEGGKVKVYVENAAACTLVVAAYDEDSAQMLATGIAEIEPDTGVAEVMMDGTLPEHYVLKAFLLDSGTHAALCKSYESREQTHAFEAFLDKHPEDFKGDTVLVFDDSKEIEDFAVLTDEVLAGTFSASMTYSYDDTTNAYTFRNATQEIKNLKKGDLFYYPGKDGAYLLFKVKDIAVSGPTVTVTQDADVGMDELFTFIRIDSEGDYDRMEGPRQEDMPDGVTLIENNVNAQWSGDVGAEFKGRHTLLCEISPDEPVFAGSARGQVGLTIQVSVHLFYDIKLFGDKYFNFLFKAGLTVNVDVSFSDAIDLTPLLKPKKGFIIPVGTTGIEVELTPMIVLRVAFSVSISAQYSCFAVLTADNGNGMRGGKSSGKFVQKLEAEHEDQLEIVIGIRDEIAVYYFADNLRLVGGIEGGARFVGTIDDPGIVQDQNAGEMLHECDFCVDGEIIGYGKADLSFVFELGQNKWLLTFAEAYLEAKLQDFYFSNKLGFGKGDCPNRLYALHVFVWEGNQRKQGARVVCTSAVCDANGDGKYTETEMTTDADGKAAFYGKPGTHTVVVTAEGYGPQEKAEEITDKEKTIIFFLQYYTLIVFVKNEEKKPISGASVFCENGQCDADGDGKYSETSMTTDTGGKAVFHVPIDADLPHILQVSRTGYKSKTDSIYVVKDRQEIVVTLEKTDFQFGDLIEYGTYPQTEVKDPELLAALNAQPKSWISYGYYCGRDRWDDMWYMKMSDYMQYCDVSLSGIKYRGVWFSHYRPAFVSGTDDSPFVTFQDDNGYFPNTVYWFRYEPLLWNVLDPDTGLVLCNTTIDSQPFNNYNDYYAHWGGDAFGINFYSSTLYDWLCNDFINTAFTQSQIQTGLSGVSILSELYEFDMAAKYDVDNLDKPIDPISFETSSDYAKCQGILEYAPFWGIQNPTQDCVIISGSSSISSFLDNYSILFWSLTCVGVRPVMRLNLYGIKAQSQSEIDQSVSAQSFGDVSEQQQQTNIATASGTIVGNEYILLVRKSGSDAFTAENLFYIDQQTASGSEVTFTYNPRMSGDAVVEIVGDFGHGIETRKVTSEPKPPAGKVRSVTVGDLSMIAKRSADLKPEVTADVGVRYTLTYTSSNPKIAEVDANGNVTTHKQGTAVITVTATDEYGNDVTDTCTVTVRYTWWQWLIVILLLGFIWY